MSELSTYINKNFYDFNNEANNYILNCNTNIFHNADPFYGFYNLSTGNNNQNNFATNFIPNFDNDIKYTVKLIFANGMSCDIIGNIDKKNQIQEWINKFNNFLENRHCVNLSFKIE